MYTFPPLPVTLLGPMEFRPEKVEGSIVRLDALVAGLRGHAAGRLRAAADRWRSDAAALLYHLRRSAAGKMLVVLGGTGTGKSTLVNRLLGKEVSATSFRRTFTSGPVAVAASLADVPAGWLGVQQTTATEADLPARGQAGALLVVSVDCGFVRRLALVDTPDLDGDQPAHHAEADRAFRWADALVFLVTPEKYQMTELFPYYRLAARYRAPALFVMNKCEQQAAADDYAALLRTQSSQGPAGAAAGFGEAPVFIVPRDDAGFEPPAGQNLDALKRGIAQLPAPSNASRAEGLRNRTSDLLGRMDDQVLVPLCQARREIDRVIALIRDMETPVPGVDVNPVTAQLQRRMQQRSVLYLMGPQRILERVRQAPGLLVRLPRVAWDYVVRGEVSMAALNPANSGQSQDPPDFAAMLKDQFAILQSRLDDALRTSPVLRQWMSDGAPPPQASAMIDPSLAGRIADEELAELRAWLERRWNATPRDTRMLEMLLKYLPGGKKITQWTEAAPYLLVLIVAAATHHLFGGIDVIVLGGWSLATWLTERLSNEVAAHTRQTNQKITDRFARLAHDQIEQICRWLNEQVPAAKALDQLQRALDEARALVEG